MNVGSNYHYFYGVCEDRNDPLEIGRIRVRVFAHHEENQDILPTEALPWAQCELPVTASDTTMPNVQLGVVVKGYWLDGESMQIPIVESVLPGLLAKDVISHLGYTDKTLTGYADGRFRSKSDSKLSLEPDDPYKASYPFNHAFESESGHVIEVDDTPGAERIHVMHRSGSFVEMHPDGKIVVRSNADRHDVSYGNAYESAKSKTVVIQGNANVHVEGDAYTKVDGNVIEEIGGNKTVTVGGTYRVKAASNMFMKAVKIFLN